MMKSLNLLVLGTAAITLASCVGISLGGLLGGGGAAQPPGSGVIYTGTKASLNCEHGGDDGCAAAKDGKAVGTKTGEACASSILGLIQTGDMSLKTAAAEGKITDVQSVDYSSMAILGSLYMQNCLIVNGK